MIPFRLGEFVRPYLLARNITSRLAWMAAVVLERMFDIIALLMLTLWVGLWVEIPAGELVVGGIDILVAGQRSMGVLALVLAVGIFGTAVTGEAIFHRLAAWINPVAPTLGARLLGTGVEVSHGFRHLAQRPKVALGALWWSGFMWGCTLISFACVMKALALTPVTASMTVTTMVSTLVGMNVLPTPGFVGGFEAGCVAGLLVFGVSRSLASAFALLFHALMFVHTGALGLGCLVWEGWSLRQVVAESQRQG